MTLKTRNPGPFLKDVDHPDAIEPALREALATPDEQLNAAQALCRELHSFEDGRSSERVMDAVERLCVGEMGPRRPKPSNRWRKLKVRWRMGHWGW